MKLLCPFGRFGVSVCFRGGNVAAPLKLAHDHMRDVVSRCFRGGNVAAPLKLFLAVLERVVTEGFPRRQRRGSVEATNMQFGDMLRRASFRGGNVAAPL